MNCYDFVWVLGHEIHAQAFFEGLKEELGIASQSIGQSFSMISGGFCQRWTILIMLFSSTVALVELVTKSF